MIFKRSRNPKMPGQIIREKAEKLSFNYLDSRTKDEIIKLGNPIKII